MLSTFCQFSINFLDNLNLCKPFKFIFLSLLKNIVIAIFLHKHFSRLKLCSILFPTMALFTILYFFTEIFHVTL